MTTHPTSSAMNTPTQLETPTTPGRWVFYTPLAIEQTDIALAVAGIEHDGLAQGARVAHDIPGNEEAPTPDQFTYQPTMVFVSDPTGQGATQNATAGSRAGSPAGTGDAREADASRAGLPIPMPIEGTWQWLEDQDWNATWKASIQPIHHGPLTILPPWLAPGTYHTSPSAITLIIEPGQAFGTGHHETTMHCVDLLHETLTARSAAITSDTSASQSAQATDEHATALQGSTPARSAGIRVADIGTGTGILALLACALGATTVVGTDIDPQAITTANQNAEVNSHIPHLDGLTFLEGSTEPAAQAHPEGYDVVVANMITPILLELSSQLVDLVAPHGVLMMSGVSMPRVREVVEVFGALGMTCEVRDGEEWAGILAHRTDDPAGQAHAAQTATQPKAGA